MLPLVVKTSPRLVVVLNEDQPRRKGAPGHRAAALNLHPEWDPEMLEMGASTQLGRAGPRTWTARRRPRCSRRGRGWVHHDRGGAGDRQVAPARRATRAG